MTDILRKQIDTNKNNTVEEKELLDFLQQEENLKAVGEHLNKGLKDILHTQTTNVLQKALHITYAQSINNKIWYNQPLSNDERNLLKLKYYLEEKSLPENNQIFYEWLGKNYANGKITYVPNDEKTKGKTSVTPTLQIKPSITPKEDIELTPKQKQLQLATILETGEMYVQYLLAKGRLKGDKHDTQFHNIQVYINELQTKWGKGEKVDMDFYLRQIFPPLTGIHIPKLVSALENIKKILTSPERWNEKDSKEKKINLLREIRQIDENTVRIGLNPSSIASQDTLTETLIDYLPDVKLEGNLNYSDVQTDLKKLKFLLPNKDGSFNDSDVEEMYKQLSITYSSNNAPHVYKIIEKYHLPHKGANESKKIAFQEKIIDTYRKEKENVKKEMKEQMIIESKDNIIFFQDQQKQLKEEAKKQGIDQNSPEFKEYVAYYQEQITTTQKLLNGERIEIRDAQNIIRTTSLDQQINEIYTDNYNEQTLITSIMQKELMYRFLNRNATPFGKDATTVNFIRDKEKSGEKLTTDEKVIAMVSSMVGAGTYLSDNTFNTLLDGSKQLAIEVSLMAISGGIANIAAKGAILVIKQGSKFLAKKAGKKRIQKGGEWMTKRAAKYANLSKRGIVSGFKTAPELLAVDIIAEGSIFHLANTLLSAPFSGMSGEQILQAINPFSKEGALGSLESIAFMGVMKGFGEITGKITQKLAGEKLIALQGSKLIKEKLMGNAITFPGEVFAMQGTSVGVNLMFRDEIGDLSPEAWIHTIAMVIGLRVAHMGTGPLHKIGEKISDATQKGELKIEITNVVYGKNGEVEKVDYRILDKNEQVLENGTASQEAIKKALERKGNDKIIDYGEKTENAYGKDATLESMTKERDRLNRLASKETDPKNQEIYNKTITKLEENIKNKLKNTGINSKIAEVSSKFKFFKTIENKTLQKIYNERIKNTTQENKEEFDLRFYLTLKYFSEPIVKFRENGKIVEGKTIEQYGENLFGKDILSTPEGKKLFDTLKVQMFNQHLDNPLQYCSHGFDHSILVDAYVQNIIEGKPLVVDKTMEKYGLNKELAILLLRLSAVFHDFGYPEIGNLAKAMHGPFGGELFLEKFANHQGGKDSFLQLFSKQFGMSNETLLREDMSNAISFHSADKVDQGYLNKVKYTKGEFLVGELNKDTNLDQNFVTILNKEGGEMTIMYRNPKLEANKVFTDENGIISNFSGEKWNGKTFKILLIEGDKVNIEFTVEGKGTIEKQIDKTLIEGELIKITENSKRNAEKIQENLKKSGVKNISIKEDIFNQGYDYEFSADRYQGRKTKVGNTGIEFKPIDLMESPLEGIVRLADNMDMSRNRLTKAQSDKLYMNLLYNLGMKNMGDGSCASLFQVMEQKADLSTINTLLKKGVFLIEFSETTGKKVNNPPIDLKFTPEEIAKIENSGNYNLTYYKQLVVEKLYQKGIVSDKTQVETIKNIASQEDVGSYSLRHFAGTTAIRDVKLIENGETKTFQDIENQKVKLEKGVTMLEVKVDREIFLNSELRSQNVQEDGRTININEYHIWRLFDASGRVEVDGKVLNIKVVDEKGTLIGITNRTKATDTFTLHIDKSTYKGGTD